MAICFNDDGFRMTLLLIILLLLSFVSRINCKCYRKLLLNLRPYQKHPHYFHVHKIKMSCKAHIHIQ